MKPILTIRARLALVSAVLSAFVLALGLMTVYLIEAHQVHQMLVAEARTAAHDLAVVGEHRESATTRGSMVALVAPAGIVYSTADGGRPATGDRRGHSRRWRGREDRRRRPVPKLDAGRGGRGVRRGRPVTLVLGVRERG